jgi:hypothetical protein
MSKGKNPRIAQMCADKDAHAKHPRKSVSSADNLLFDRVVSILEQARGNVVRAVNTGMVTAYWLIGREIVEAVQGGEERAEYGKELIANLSIRLTERYGKGFSEQSLQNFRRLYLVYSERFTIPSPAGREAADSEKLFPPGRESGVGEGISSPSGRELAVTGIRCPTGSEFAPAFSSHLSWSHYRALMRVEDRAARDFYEREAVAKYSVLSEGRQIFASKYLQFLPSEEELRIEVQKERRLIEAALEEKEQGDES